MDRAPIQSAFAILWPILPRTNILSRLGRLHYYSKDWRANRSIPPCFDWKLSAS
jgi:hypothetical protein